MITRRALPALLRNPAHAAFQTPMRREAEVAARTLRVELQIVEARAVADLDVALQTARPGAGGLLVLADPAFTVHRARLARLTAKARLPTLYGIREAPEAGASCPMARTTSS